MSPADRQTVTVFAHLGATSVLSSRIYPEDDRVTVCAAGMGTDVTLFALRADLVRLGVAVADALAKLDRQQEEMAAEFAADLDDVPAA